MQVSRVNREYRNVGSNDEPANSNRRPRSADVIPFRGGQTPDDNPLHQTQDEQFSTRYQNPYATDRPTNQSINRVERQYEQAPRPAPPRRRIPNLRRKKVLHKHSAQHTTKVALARARVTAINGWVVGWAVTWYFAFQWWLSFLSLAGLGMAVAAYAAIQAIPGGRFLLPIIEGVVGGVSTFAGAVVEWALSLFGISFDPIWLFFIPTALLLFMGIFQLLLTWFMYSCARVHSLSGTHGGLKQLLFVLAFISSVTPLPLIFLWIAVVWMYPK